MQLAEALVKIQNLQLELQTTDGQLSFEKNLRQALEDQLSNKVLQFEAEQTESLTKQKLLEVRIVNKAVRVPG